MQRLIGFSLAMTTAFSVAALAAPEHERIRGTVASISGDTMAVRTADGVDVPVVLGSDTRYAKVEKSSLNSITEGSYIGTATKSLGSILVALEVVVFPPAMRGAGEGHYGWDKIPDTTLSGAGSTPSTMTNGSVAAVAPASVPPAVNSTMTNGNVAAVASRGGEKQLTVTYKGGQEMILVPPTAPIVTFAPGAMTDVTKGAAVFVNATKDGDKVSANSVAYGSGGVKPPM